MTLRYLPATATEPEEYAIRCDMPGCDLEIAAPTQDDVLQDAALSGFKFEPQGTRHCCIECQRGNNPTLQQMQQQLQAALAGGQVGQGDGGSTPQAPPDPSGWLN